MHARFFFSSSPPKAPQPPVPAVASFPNPRPFQLCSTNRRTQNRKVFHPLFSDISEQNNDYSDTLDFRRGRGGGGHVFVLEVPDYESAMLIYFYIYILYTVFLRI